MSSLEVKIKGTPKSGKTTLAVAIAEKLSELGAQVTIQDDEPSEALRHKNLGTLAGKKVLISTVS